MDHSYTILQAIPLPLSKNIMEIRYRIPRRGESRDFMAVIAAKGWTAAPSSAKRQGISVDALLERLMNDPGAGTAVRPYHAPELPVLHLGPMGPLHRRDIYDADP
jgi:hypothetical protein